MNKSAGRQADMTAYDAFFWYVKTCLLNFRKKAFAFFWAYNTTCNKHNIIINKFKLVGKNWRAEAGIKPASLEQ